MKLHPHDLIISQKPHLQIPFIPFLDWLLVFLLLLSKVTSQVNYLHSQSGHKLCFGKTMPRAHMIKLCCGGTSIRKMVSVKQRERGGKGDILIMFKG
jgi:hypothetical protein